MDSQSGAAAAIIEAGAEVAGIGGFSGKESSVSAGWLEERIESGAIAWIYTSGLGGLTGAPGVASGGQSTTGASAGGQSRSRRIRVRRHAHRLRIGDRHGGRILHQGLGLGLQLGF